MTKPDPDVPDPETRIRTPTTPGQPGDRSGSGLRSAPGTSPEPAWRRRSPDPAADAPPADDDAVWLDLVARLEGVGTGGDEAARGN